MKNEFIASSDFRKSLIKMWGIFTGFLLTWILISTFTGKLGPTKTFPYLWFFIIEVPFIILLLNHIPSWWERSNQSVPRATFSLVRWASILFFVLVAAIILVFIPVQSSPDFTTVAILVSSSYVLWPSSLLIGILMFSTLSLRAAKVPTVEILFVAANPTNLQRIGADRELRKIKQGLREAKLGDNFNLNSIGATTLESLHQALLDHNPRILHFAGHGSNEGLDVPTSQDDATRHLEWQDDDEAAGSSSGVFFLETEGGEAHGVSGKGITSLIQLMVDELECVILNSCYSKYQAEELSKHVKYVIGTRYAIADKIAIAFSVAFYRTLGTGKSIPFSVEAAKAIIESEGGNPEIIIFHS